MRQWPLLTIWDKTKGTSDEVKGRNTWLMWTGGNEAFWDFMSQHSYGLCDLLKTLDSRKRPTRFKEMGMVNEPGFTQASKQDQYGLWLDERVGPEAEGVDPKVYGKASGIVGLRLYPNPAFDATAKQNWNAEKYYNDPTRWRVIAAVRRKVKIGDVELRMVARPASRKRSPHAISVHGITLLRQA